jgi:hypothetical protein
MFSSRGNPWVSEKEGLTQYGRTMETENPDFDQFVYAKKAAERREMASEKAEKLGLDVVKRKMNIVNRMNRKLRGLK